MEKVENKRKVKNAKTLEGKYIYKIMLEKKEDKIDEKSEKIEETKKEEKSKKDAFFIEEKPKIEKVGPFQLVVIKLPWYKRAVRSLMSFLGFYYE